MRHWIGPFAINTTCADDVEVAISPRFDKSVCKLFSNDCIMDVGEESCDCNDDCDNDDPMISIDEKCNPFIGKNVDAYSFHDKFTYNEHELSHKTIVSGLSKGHLVVEMMMLLYYAANVYLHYGILHDNEVETVDMSETY